MPRKKIIIIEDERDISETLAFNLKREGYQVWLAEDGETGLSLVIEHRPDVVLLDLMLPGMEGEEVCRQIKADRLMRDTYVIMLTAKEEESDVVLGLGLGADDYVTKPFRMREVLARVGTVQRRGPLRVAGGERAVIVCGPLEVDTPRHEVRFAGKAVTLTSTEFRILAFLAGNCGRVFTRDQILNHTIGVDAVVIDRNIDVHINSIRRKLGEGGPMIQTVRSVGYRFAEEVRA